MLKYDRSQQPHHRDRQLYPSTSGTTTANTLYSQRIIVIRNPFVPITRLTAIRVIRVGELAILRDAVIFSLPPSLSLSLSLFLSLSHFIFF